MESIPVLFVVVLGFACVVRADFYLSTTGNDNNSGTSPESPFLTWTRARDAVRSVVKPTTSDLNVFIFPGTYYFEEPLLLNQSDSGVSGFMVHWQPYGEGEVIVSGGIPITGWTFSEPPQVRDIPGQCPTETDLQQTCGYPYSTEDDCYANGCCWTEGGLAPSGSWCNFPLPAVSTPVEADISAVQNLVQNRHLFVNGQRATRTWVPLGGVFGDAPVLTEDGFLVSSLEPLQWPRQGAGVEFVWPQSTSPWTEPRCAVANVTQINSTASFIYMMQPCFYNLVNKPCGQGCHGPPQYIENGGLAFLNFSGMWTLDLDAGKVYYLLRDGETPESLQVVMPVLEVLIQGEGVYGQPIQNIKFSGISFQHATWLRPGQGDGYVEQQSGSCIVGTNPDNYVCNDDYMWVKSPGNINFQTSSNIVFDSCEFAHLGGVGLDFGEGAHANIVNNCYFHDISGAAVQFGSFDTFNETDPLREDIGNVLNNSLVFGAAVEFHGAVGVNLGYTLGSVVTYNEICNLTYGGISMGWGWSHRGNATTFAGNNTIAYNRVHDFKQDLNDGGGIYTLGPQEGTVVHDNWVYHQITNGGGGSLYPDEGSAFMTWYRNVVNDISSGSEWLHLWTSSIHNITVEDNFSDTDVFENHGTNCPMINNTIYTPGNPPPEAVAIMDLSGTHGNPFYEAFLKLWSTPISP